MPTQNIGSHKVLHASTVTGQAGGSENNPAFGRESGGKSAESLNIFLSQRLRCRLPCELTSREPVGLFDSCAL